MKHKLSGDQFDLDVKKYNDAFDLPSDEWGCYWVVDPYNTGNTRVQYASHIYLNLLYDKYGVDRLTEGLWKLKHDS